MGIAGVAYDSSAGIIEVAFRVQSTIVPLVLGGFEFYLLVIMNCTVFISQRLGYFDPTEYHVDLPWGLTGVTGSLMTFFCLLLQSACLRALQQALQSDEEHDGALPRDCVNSPCTGAREGEPTEDCKIVYC